MDFKILGKWTLILLLGFCVFASVTYGVLTHRTGPGMNLFSEQTTTLNQVDSQSEGSSIASEYGIPHEAMDTTTESNMLSDEIFVSANIGKNLQVNHDSSIPEQVSASNPLSSAMLETLLLYDWMDRVVNSRGVWICVQRQMMYILDGIELVWQAPVATGASGTGFVWGSNQTPLGWHRVDEKIGDNAPWGQIFRARGQTARVWQPGDDVKEDLVLTRILWLGGEEPGVNQGYNALGELVDSKRRFIYIHGTNGEADIGTPSSQGCIRMLNNDVILAYDMIPVGTPVLITE